MDSQEVDDFDVEYLMQNVTMLRTFLRSLLLLCSQDLFWYKRLVLVLSSDLDSKVKPLFLVQ
jgi:hypothetical protein